MHSSEGYAGTEEALCYATEHCCAVVLHTRRGEAEYNTEKRPDILIFNNEDALILVVALRTESAQHRGSCKEMSLQD